MIEDFKAVVARLRNEQGLSLEELGYRARAWASEHPSEDENGGVSLSLVQKRLAPSSKKSPSSRLLEALSAALDVPPEVFLEYRLAIARRLFDPTVVGLPQATQNLALLEAVFGPLTADPVQKLAPGWDEDPKAAARAAREAISVCGKAS